MRLIPRRLFRQRSAVSAGSVFIGIALNAGCPPVPRLPSTTIGAKELATGFTSPVALVQPASEAPLIVVDQVGLAYTLDASGQRSTTPLLDVRSQMVQLSPTYDERGLLSIAFHPDFANNRRLFVTYNAPPTGVVEQPADSILRLSEFQAPVGITGLLGASVDLATERVILEIVKPQYNHNGGQLAFGADGMLYFSVGDGGGGNDEAPGHTPGIGNAQDRSKLLGKMLRLDVNTTTVPYIVPTDNPFLGDANARPEIWATGLRNPWRFSFDRQGDGELFLADAGQDLFEEVNIITRAGNYGWRIREASSCFNVSDPGTPLANCPNVGPLGDPLIDPIIELAHTGPGGVPLSSVVIGGYVYRGSAAPALFGKYIFADFSITLALPEGRLFAAERIQPNRWTLKELLVSGASRGMLNKYILALGQDAAGELYVLASGNLGPVGTAGVIYKLEPAP